MWVVRASGKVVGVSTFPPQYDDGIPLGYIIESTSDDHPVVIAFASPDLRSYANAKLASVSNGGITVNIGTIEQPLMVSVDTTAEGRSDLLGMMMQSQLGVTQWTWFQSTGALSIDYSQLQTIANSVAAFRASVFHSWQAVVSGIAAGTITTVAGIDAAAWPANS